MTADVELLPCPFCGSEGIDPNGWASTDSAGPACGGCGAGAGGVSGTLQDNIKAWNRRATAAMDAEIEALRAEVGRLMLEMGCLQQQYDERTAYVIVHRGAALACSDAVRAAYSDEHHRAERLAEALRLYMSAGFGNSTDFYKQAEAKRAATKALAAQPGGSDNG